LKILAARGDAADSWRMSAPRRIWVTRTEPQAQATAARLRKLGFQVIVAPVLEARQIPDATIDLTGADAIAFTSGHGVQAFAHLCENRDLPVFAVGDTTAELASKAGFTQVTVSRGGASGLALTIGLEPSADLAALLAEQGVGARIVAVYRTAAITPDQVPSDVDVVLIHSAKAARIVARMIPPDQAAVISVLAISEAAAAPLRALPFAHIAAAPFPDEAHLLALLQA
jgi:uroporphyrinogen-III synthase